MKFYFPRKLPRISKTLKIETRKESPERDREDHAIDWREPRK
jgi:hypothetical protein